MFDKILIANRGEIACRVMRTCKRLGVQTVAVFSTPDENSEHVRLADEAFHIGEAASAESYLRGDRILDVCRMTGAQAVHPGYGFLSENAAFSAECKKNGVTFIGPPESAIEDMGSKSASKRIMTKAGVPCVPGYHGDEQDDGALFEKAKGMGFPVMIKAVLGGGGKGMRIVETPEEFLGLLDNCRREAMAHFKDDRVLLERYVTNPRHVEFQVFADTHGNAVHLFERDCSVQRRHQKVLEESPAPGMSPELRARMGQAAVDAAKAVGYVGAGTVEFILEPGNEFFFMEMNTRLQVEHPVTEMVTRQDLVEWQLRVAAGETLPLTQDDLVAPIGHAIEARIYAENPRNGFLPGSGSLRHMGVPSPHCSFDNSASVRVDSGVVQGGEVSVHYDPMIAKLIVSADDRPAALKKMVASLRDFNVVGLPTNIDFVQACCAHPAFEAGGVDTGFIDENVDALLPELPPTTPQTVALAAIASALASDDQSSKGSGGDPWDASALRSFRSVSSASARLDLTDDSGAARKIALTQTEEGDIRVRVDSDDAMVVRRASLTSDGILEATVNGQVRKVKVVFDETSRSVHLFFPGPPEIEARPQQSYFHFSVPPPSYGVDGSGGSGATAITAPMPGKVVKVLVEPGAQVAIGEPVVVLEAMKMEHVLEAPCDGTIGEIFAAVGDFVDDSAELVHFGSED